MPKYDFNKVACNFIEIRHWHGCSPVGLLYIFRTPFLQNISGEMLRQNKFEQKFITTECVVITTGLPRISNF